MDVWIIKETCLDLMYEVNSTPIEDNWIVIDIGAGLGDFAVLVANKRPNCRIFAFEPYQESYELLVENIQLNSADNVQPFPLAVGANSGELMLYASGTAVQFTTTKGLDTGRMISIPVQGVSLDDLFVINGIMICDYLKIDCEGGEYEILFNASKATLRKIRHLCLEYHEGVTQFSHTDLADYLQEMGFRVKITPNPAHNFLGLLYAYH